MGLSDSATRPSARLWLPSPGCSGLAAERLCWASQVPGGSVCARCLLSPRRVRPLHLVDASGTVLASPLLKGWPLSRTFNEAGTSSRDTTARAFAASGFDGQDCSRLPQSWLQGFRPFTMMNTLQFIRTTELCLAHQEATEKTKTSTGGARSGQRTKILLRIGQNYSELLRIDPVTASAECQREGLKKNSTS
jgi:hypothetical protein